MKSIFRYPGGKSKKSVSDWILSHAPAGLQEYREPCVGGGGVFFALSSGGLKKRWVNDLNDGLMEVYLALRDRPEDFITKCKMILPQRPNEPLTPPGKRGGKGYNARLAAKFNELKLNTTCDQALRYFFINRTVFGGRVNYAIESRLYFSNPSGWNIVKTNQLEKAAEHLQNTTITKLSYEKLLVAEGTNVWIYLDPPYYVNTNLNKASQLYEHNFDEKDHEVLRDLALSCNHALAISYDDCPFIRDLYSKKSFNIKTRSWTYSGTTNKQKSIGKEILILNY